MLPRWYRDDRADEMTATVLAERTDRVDLEYSWPGWNETGSVATLAIRTRLAGDRGPARALAWGQAVRLVALLGLLTFASTALGYYLARAVVPGPLGFLNIGGPDPNWPGVASIVFDAAAVAAFVALVLGRRTTALALGAAAIGGLLAIRVARVAAGLDTWRLLTDAGLLLLLGVPVLCLLLGYHREAPPVAHARRWLAAAAALTLVSAAMITAQLTAAGPLGLSIPRWAFVLGTLAALATPRLAAVRQSAGWMTALAISGTLLTAAGVQLSYYAVQLGRDAHLPGLGGYVMVTLIETAVVAAVTIAAAVAAERGLRRLGMPTLAT
jgi:hypothetical protein